MAVISKVESGLRRWEVSGKKSGERKNVSLDFLTQRPGKVGLLGSCSPGRRPAGPGSDQLGWASLRVWMSPDRAAISEWHGQASRLSINPISHTCHAERGRKTPVLCAAARIAPASWSHVQLLVRNQREKSLPAVRVGKRGNEASVCGESALAGTAETGAVPGKLLPAPPQYAAVTHPRCAGGGGPRGLLCPAQIWKESQGI